VTFVDSPGLEARPVTRRARAVSLTCTPDYIDVLLSVLSIDPDPLRFAAAALTDEREFWVAQWARLGDEINPRTEARISKRIVRVDRALEILEKRGASCP
jgi:hypothetical protein